MRGRVRWLIACAHSALWSGVNHNGGAETMRRRENAGANRYIDGTRWGAISARTLGRPAGALVGGNLDAAGGAGIGHTPIMPDRVVGRISARSGGPGSEQRHAGAALMSSIGHE